MSRKHLLAVNKLIADAQLAARPQHAPTVQLARDVARQLDAIGTAEAPVTLLAEYRGALRDLRRAAKETAAITRREKGSKPAQVVESESIEAIAGLSDLELFRREHGVHPDADHWSTSYRAALLAEVERRHGPPRDILAELEREQARSLKASEESNRHHGLKP